MQASISLDKYIKALEQKYVNINVSFIFPELEVLLANGVTQVLLTGEEIKELKEWL